MPVNDDNISGLRVKNESETVEVVAVIQSDRGPVAILDNGSMRFVGEIRDEYDVVTDEPEATATPAASSEPAPAAPANPTPVAAVPDAGDTPSTPEPGASA